MLEKYGPWVLLAVFIGVLSYCSRVKEEEKKWEMRNIAADYANTATSKLESRIEDLESRIDDLETKLGE